MHATSRITRLKCGESKDKRSWIVVRTTSTFDLHPTDKIIARIPRIPSPPGECPNQSEIHQGELNDIRSTRVRVDQFSTRSSNLFLPLFPTFSPSSFFLLFYFSSSVWLGRGPRIVPSDASRRPANPRRMPRLTFPAISIPPLPLRVRSASYPPS